MCYLFTDTFYDGLIYLFIGISTIQKLKVRGKICIYLFIDLLILAA